MLLVGFVQKSRLSDVVYMPAITAQLNTRHIPSDKPRIIHFWAEWCRICRFEQGAIDSLSEKYPVITVAVDSGDVLAVRHIVERRNIAAPVYVDSDYRLSRSVKVRAYPTTLFVDGQGKIRFAEVGYSSYPGLVVRWWLLILLFS